MDVAVLQRGQNHVQFVCPQMQWTWSILLMSINCGPHTVHYSAFLWWPLVLRTKPGYLCVISDSNSLGVKLLKRILGEQGGVESTDCGFVCCDNLHPYSVFMDQLCLHSNMPFAFAEVWCCVWVVDKMNPSAASVVCTVKWEELWEGKLVPSMAGHVPSHTSSSKWCEEWSIYCHIRTYLMMELCMGFKSLIIN